MMNDSDNPFEIGAEIITSIRADESPKIGDIRPLNRFGWGVLAHYRITKLELTRLGWFVEGVIVGDPALCDRCGAEVAGRRCPACFELSADERAARMFTDLAFSD